MTIDQISAMSADAAAGALSSLAFQKRNMLENAEGERETKMFKTDHPSQTPTTAFPSSVPPTTQVPPQTVAAPSRGLQVGETRRTVSKAKQVRLEQNRKAARESRRRKKVMIEELQRSIIFFSRANGTLKQQNEDLSRLLIEAKAKVAAHHSGDKTQEAQASAQAGTIEPVESKASDSEKEAQTQAQVTAAQAEYESRGFPPAAARAAAAQTNGASESKVSAPAAPKAPEEDSAAATGTAGAGVPPMQPGATMQAMANFQQAAAAAMQAAIQGMQGIPGMNMMHLAATPAGSNAQQAYTDAMTALAMQQAAAAAAGHQFAFTAGMPFFAQMMVWQHHHQQQLVQQMQEASRTNQQVGASSSRGEQQQQQQNAESK